MGWINRKLQEYAKGVLGAAPVQLTFAPNIQTHDIDGAGQPLEADKCYLELYLESLKLEQARKFGTTFDAVVYSSVKLASAGEPSAKLSAISKPAGLQELDQGQIDRVITTSKRLMASTPYRGGPVSLELGLFSVKRGNLISAALEFVSKVSDTAGITSVIAAKPFIPLLVDGMDLIAGSADDTVLEVGLDTDMAIKESCVFAVIATSKDDIDSKSLALEEDGTLLHQGSALQCGYATFSIRYAAEKPDYGEIPDLKDAYAKVINEVRKNDQRAAREALQAFRLTALTSPDLILDDAKRLVAKVRELVHQAFEPTASFDKAKFRAETLRDLGLYS